MAHRALTLKYRPQVFADMVGQDHVSTVLAAALETGRVAHAFLFTGARGVGKTTSARILAKALNCERRASGALKGADPCNVCTSCTEITSGISLDVTEIDGASNRGIADVQVLREKVRFAPTGGRYRVVIIDEVHQLSNDAFAALLKTLEEPPRHLVFIFATTDPQKLPDTIRSRTQRYDFARVPVKQVAGRLLEIAKREASDPDGVTFTLTEGAAILIGQKSEGALRDAVSALDQVISSGETEVSEELVRRVLGIADREAFFALADAIVAHDPKAALQALHRAFAKGIDPRELAEGLSEHIRHILILKVDPEGEDLVPATGEEILRLAAQGSGWSEHDLLRLLRIVSDVMWPMRDSPQPLVHLEAAILQMATLEAGETLADLLARLEALERRLGGAPAGPAAGSGATPRAAAPRSSGAATAVVPRASGAAPVALRTSAAPPTLREAGVSSPAPSVPPKAGAMAPHGASETSATLVAELPAVGAPAAAVAVLDETSYLRDERIEGCWQAVIAAVNGKKRMLGAFLEESRFLGASATSLGLAMDALHRAVIEEKENYALLGDEVERAFGLRLEVACPEATGGALAPAVGERESVDVKQMIDRAVEWFGGEAVTEAEPRAPRPEKRGWRK